MFRLTFNLQFSGVADPRTLGREGKRLWREALREGAEYWDREIAPRHFTPAAVSRYGYRPRSKGYQIHKAVVAGTTAPLTYSHRTKSRVLQASNSRANIRAYPTRAVLTVRVPIPQAALNPKPGSQRPRLGEEIVAVRPDENVEIAAVVMRRFMAGVPKLKDQQSVFKTG